MKMMAVLLGGLHPTTPSCLHKRPGSVPAHVCTGAHLPTCTGAYFPDHKDAHFSVCAGTSLPPLHRCPSHHPPLPPLPHLPVLFPLLLSLLCLKPNPAPLALFCSTAFPLSFPYLGGGGGVKHSLLGSIRPPTCAGTLERDS